MNQRSTRAPVLLLGLLAALPVAALEQDALEEGRAIAADRNRGNCFSCHAAEGVEMPGNSGPVFIQMKMRFPEREELKAQIVDPRRRNPETVMPPYGAHGILSERELELVVDFVHSL